MSESQTREHGDRAAFMARVRSLAARPTDGNMAHPLPAEPARVDGFVPIIYASLGRDGAGGDLVESYVRNATTALLDVRRVEGYGPSDEFLRALITAENVRRAVVSKAPAAMELGARLARLGVEVVPYSPTEAVDADLGVSCPFAGIAATGSLVQDSSREGGRGVSLVPRVHLALLPASKIVATTADVLRTLTGRVGTMPSNVALISGPSRTGDIEMILTVGVHGPVKVIVALSSLG